VTVTGAAVYANTHAVTRPVRPS